MGSEIREATAAEVFRASLQLGCTAFGGPIAHLGYFAREFVERRRWIGGEAYAGLVALCQTLPGPTSSQVNFLIGMHCAGWRGACAAWLGFTLPAALLMFALASCAPHLHGPVAEILWHGLKLVAVAVVAQAVWSMALRLCRGPTLAVLAVLAAVAALLFAGAGAQLSILAAGAVAGWVLCRDSKLAPFAPSREIGAAAAAAALLAYLFLLLVLPLLALSAPRGPLGLAAIFYRAGALVFGGGHVVLPLLRGALVPGGWLTDAQFLDGYGAAQALPGPLFTVSAYLGALAAPGGAAPGSAAMGWAAMAWAGLALLAMFLPGLLIAVAGAAVWRRLQELPGAAAALGGVNAAVVGILAAALYDPVAVTAIHGSVDVAIAAGGFLLLERLKLSPAWVVLACLAASALAAA